MGIEPIKVGSETIGSIAVDGAPGGDHDEACAKAGLNKINGRLKYCEGRAEHAAKPISVPLSWAPALPEDGWEWQGLA